MCLKVPTTPTNLKDLSRARWENSGAWSKQDTELTPELTLMRRIHTIDPNAQQRAQEQMDIQVHTGQLVLADYKCSFKNKSRISSQSLNIIVSKNRAGALRSRGISRSTLENWCSPLASGA